MHDQTRSSLELLYSISRRLVSSIELKDVLRLVVQLAVENLGAERCTLIALDPQGAPVAVIFIRDGRLQELDQTGIRPILEDGLAGWVMRKREAVLIDDTSRDERWLVRPDDLSGSTGPKSALCIPLTASDQLVGVMTIVHPQPHFFTQDHLDLMVAIAAQAGIAIYNALLVDSLQAAKARYRDLFDESVLPILVTDHAGQVIEANHRACEMVGCSTGDFFGVNISTLHTPDDPAMKNQFGGLSGKQTLIYEALLSPLNFGGPSVPVEVYVRPALIQDKPCLQWTLRDISERRALDLLRSDMVAMIYHDLRSPLANIISSLDMLEGLIPADVFASLKPVLSIANRSSNRMQRLINSLLDLHRLESGQMVNRSGWVQVNDLVQDTVDTVAPTLEGKRQSIQVSLPAGPLEVQIDPDMIRRVLINLLENASKYSPVQSSLEIGATSDEDWVKLWVQDNGPGIPEERRDYIFEKFARLQPNQFPKGVGLGLAFCQLAVQSHGGKIWVESPPAQGSRFVFTLPKKLTESSPG